MVKLICVGCGSWMQHSATTFALPKEGSRPVKKRPGVVHPPRPKDAPPELSTEAFILCPNCDGNPNTELGVTPDGRISASLAWRSSLLGRNFYDLALAICQECGNRRTFSVLEHGLDSLNLPPLATYMVVCDICTPGEGRFRLVSDAFLHLGEHPGDEHYEVKTYYNLLCTIGGSEPVPPSLEDCEIPAAKRALYQKVLDAMTEIQEGVVAITRREAAEALGVTPATAGRYLREMVDLGLVSEIPNGRTAYFMRQHIN